MRESEEIIKHYGVLGMKWGVRKDQNAKKSGGGESALKANLASLKREREWSKVLRNVNNMTTKEVKEVTNRITKENDLKRLSRSSVGDSKAKKDYLNRAKMSNQELSRKVGRLQAKENLQKQVMSASKEQRDFGKRVVNTAKSLSATYAVSKMTNKKTTTSDIIDVLKNPKQTGKTATDNIQKELLKKLSQKATKTKVEK